MFPQSCLPWQIFTQGKESRVGTTLRKGCMAHIRSLAQATSAPRARARGSEGPRALQPHGQCFVG